MRKLGFNLTGMAMLLVFTPGGHSQASISQASIQSVTVTPTAAVTIGSAQQFTANVAGSGSYSSAVTWSLAAIAGSTLSPGTLTPAGLYTTPYPAPASVNITATSVQDPTKSAAVVIPLSPPATVAGPALTVDTANQTHAISPYIYGMNAFRLASSVGKGYFCPTPRKGLIGLIEARSPLFLSGIVARSLHSDSERRGLRCRPRMIRL
jgi:hypothetical protein